MTIRSFLTKGTPDSDALRRCGKTPAMMDFFEKVVGPYPFDAYGAVTVDDPALYYALETQAMSTFPSTDVDDLTVVHELAHQWFGDAVTVARWRDLWLAEGFATYFEYLWPYRGNRPGLETGLPIASIRSRQRSRTGGGEPPAGHVRGQYLRPRRARPARAAA